MGGGEVQQEGEMLDQEEGAGKPCSSSALHFIQGPHWGGLRVRISPPAKVPLERGQRGPAGSSKPQADILRAPPKLGH